MQYGLDNMDLVSSTFDEHETGAQLTDSPNLNRTSWHYAIINKKRPYGRDDANKQMNYLGSENCGYNACGLLLCRRRLLEKHTPTD